MKNYYNTHFYTATSAPVEGYFADMKNELRKGQSIMSVDRFVASHLNSIEGTIKIAKSNRIIQTKKKILCNLSIDKCNLNYSHGETSCDDVNQREDDFYSKNDDLSVHNDDDKCDNEIYGQKGVLSGFNDDDKCDYDFYSKNDDFSVHNDDDKCDNNIFGENGDLSVHNDDDKCDNDFNGDNGDLRVHNDDDICEKSDEKNEIESSESEISEYLNENIKATENWRNKGETPYFKETVKAKGNRSTKYKDGCADIRKILNSSRLRSTNKTILNGNLLSAVKIQRQRLLVSNTCAFDSLLVALTVGYMDFDNFRKYMDGLIMNNKFLNLCRDVALHGSSVSTYMTRAEILMDSGVYDKTEIQQGTSMLNCEANVVGLSNRLLSNTPSSVQTKSCENCNIKKQFYSPTVILKSGKNIDLTTLNDLITTYTDTKTTKCKLCKNNSYVNTRKLNNHLLIETDFLFENECRLSDIPTEIFIQNFRYLFLLLMGFFLFIKVYW